MMKELFREIPKIPLLLITLMLLFVLAFPLVGHAQVATCNVTATAYKGDGSRAAGASLVVTKVVKTGVSVATGAIPVKADENGNISFSVLRGSTITLNGNVIIGGTDLTKGATYPIPDAASVTLESLSAMASVPSSGLTLKINNSPQPNKIGTLDCGAGLNCTESPTGELNVSTIITTDALPSGIDAQKIADGSVSNAEFQRLHGVTSPVQTQLDSKAAQAALTNETQARRDADNALQGNIDGKAALVHTHGIPDVNGLQAALDAKAAASALATHMADTSNPHGVTAAQVGALTQTQGDARYSLAGHTHGNATGSTPGFMSAADKTKLDGIAAGATANSTDTYLLSRANHTGTQPLSTISDAGTAASKNVPATGNASTLQVVMGSDTRLADARTPTAHASTHGAGGSDPVTIGENQVTNLPTDLVAKAPTSRTISAGTGLSGGGDLSADRALSVTPDTTNQQIRVSKGGTLAGTRREINLIEGANTTITATDDATNNRVNVTVTSTNPGGTVTGFSATTPQVFYDVTVTNPTTTPNLSLTLRTQSANCVFAGPASGLAAAPSCRLLVPADIPDLSATYATLTGVQTLTNKTLTSPKIGTSLLDANGNTMVAYSPTASAVNYFTMTNAASGGSPVLSATGSGSNIDINLTPKGTGAVRSGADFLLSTTGSTTTTPRTFGISGLNTGEAARFQFGGDPLNSIQANYGGRTTLQSYWGVEIYGSRQVSPGVQGFTTGTTTDPVLSVIATKTNTPVLVVKTAASATANAQEWQDSSGNVKGAISSGGNSLYLYNTSETTPTNYERGKFEWAGSVLEIGSQAAGTGAARDVHLRRGTANGIYLSSSGIQFYQNLLAGADNTYDIGASGANRPRNGYFANNIILGNYLQVGGVMQFGGKSIISSAVDGNISLQNNAQTGFSLLQFGGTTASFPAWKRNGAAFEARTADDGGGASIVSSLRTDTFAASQTVDLKLGNVHTITLTGNITTLTLSNSIAGGIYYLLLVQDATGGRTVTWPASVKWPSGTAPTLSGAGKTDEIRLIYDGTNYIASAVLNF